MIRWLWKLRGWFGEHGVAVRLRLRHRRLCAESETFETRILPSGSGVLTGVAFIDANDSHTKDTNELLVPGLTVHLTGTADDSSTVDVQATADSQGMFQFISIPAGTYSLTADPDQILLAQSVQDDGIVVGTGTVTHDLGVGGVLPQFISLRQFLTTTDRTSTSPDFQFAAPGTGQVAASNNAPTLRAGQPADISVAQSAAPTTVDLAGVFNDPDYTNSLVRMHTTGGDVNIELLDSTAPQTVANFFNYVNANRYSDTIFHRLVMDPSLKILQGGDFKFDATAKSFSEIAKDPTIKDEFGLPNTAGTISMAKTGAVNSASNQFFFNLDDNSTTLDPAHQTNGGFTVFGKLLSAADTAVVNDLAGTPVKDESATNSNFATLPLQNYSPATGTTFPSNVTADNLLHITSVETIQQDEKLTYSVVSVKDQNGDPTSLVTPTITNNRLSLAFASGQRGVATVTVRATDKAGATTDATFSVIVGNHAPTASVTLSPDNPSATDTLTATATTSDSDSDPVTYTYLWKVNDSVVKTTSNTTALTDTLNPGSFTAGDKVTVDVTPNDGFVDGTNATASKTVV